MNTQVFKVNPGEQAPQIARRYFGMPLGADEESAAVLRYYFEHELGFADGVLPAELREVSLPPAAALFKLYRDRTLGDRPTGRWTRQRRAQRPDPSKRRL